MVPYALIASLDFQKFLRPCTRPHPTCTAIHIRYCQKLLQQRGLPSDEASECFSLSSIQRPEFFWVPNKWKGRNKSASAVHQNDEYLSSDEALGCFSLSSINRGTDFFVVLNKWKGQNKSVSFGPLKCFSVSLI